MAPNHLQKTTALIANLSIVRFQNKPQIGYRYSIFFH
jgi:hypothetical protein